MMRLLEIVRAEETSPEVIASCLNMAKTIKKIPAVVGVCFGFVGNRMLEPYSGRHNKAPSLSHNHPPPDYLIVQRQEIYTVLTMEPHIALI